MLAKNKRTSDTWYLRFYEAVDDKRIYRKVRLGTVHEFPRRRDAERAAEVLRGKINSEVRSPETLNALITHYRKHELTTTHKAFSTVETNGSFIKLYVSPKWVDVKLTDVRTVAVEQWLHTLPLAPATRTKVKAVFSALFAHAVRNEWVTHNPILAVRSSSERLAEKDVLDPMEFAALLGQLSICHRAMVLLAGSTGLRRSEFVGLRWNEVDCLAQQVSVTRSCVKNRFGKTKTRGSKKPVPLHPVVLDALQVWRQESLYVDAQDFIFASVRMNGRNH
jgi:integrase